MLAATGLAIAPLLMSGFGFSFEQAVAMSMVQGIIISMGWCVFGISAAPGWITPALPLVLTAVLTNYDLPADRFKTMTAMALMFSLLLAVIWVARLGSRIQAAIPAWVVVAALLGAGIAALVRIFDITEARNIFNVAPWVAITSLPAAIVFTFLVPKFAHQLPAWLSASLIRYGILFSLVIAGVVGELSSELSFKLENRWFIPPVDEMWAKASPWVIGWPGLEHYVTAVPIVIVTYLIMFSDLLTLGELNRPISAELPKESTDPDNIHGALAARNALMSMASPFFSTQGPMWTGVQAWLVERQQRSLNDTRLIDRIASYYLLGIPIAYLVSPIMLLLKPLMAITLALTLALTAFACLRAAHQRQLPIIDKGLAFTGGIMIAVAPAYWAAAAIIGAVLTRAVWLKYWGQR